MTHPHSRAGYALLLVLAFITVLSSTYGLASLHLANAVRVETSRVTLDDRNQGALQATAMMLTLFQTGKPPTNPYTCAVTVATPAGSRKITVIASSSSSDRWTITARPTLPNESPPSAPSSF